MANIGDAFQSGNVIPCSGVYRVTHEAEHAPAHEVMCICEEVFPRCDVCGKDARFELVRAAEYVQHSYHFQGPMRYVATFLGPS
jgi:hypothetical protein